MGDGTRSIARAFYETADEKEKNEAHELFWKLELNGDRKISLKGYQKGVKPADLSNEKVFNELDLDRDGWLDFDDILVLFYYEKHKITSHQCACCRVRIFGPRFSCPECLLSEKRYDVCCVCYWGSKSRHQHRLLSMSTSTELLHEQALLVRFSELMPQDPKSLSKEDFENLWETAKKSHNEPVSKEVDEMADNFFKNMEDYGTNQKKTKKSAADKFLETRSSDPTTNFMKDQMKRILGQSNDSLPRAPTGTGVTAHHSEATPSTPQTRYANHQSHGPNSEGSSSKSIVRPSSVLKAGNTALKLLDAALTIANLASMCTIL